MAQALTKTIDIFPKDKLGHGALIPVELKKHAIALHSLGYSMENVANTVGIAKGTVHKWVHGQDIDRAEIAELCDRLKESLTDRLMVNADRLLIRAQDEDKIEKASTLQLVTAGSILIDKARLLRGESTENVAVMGKKVIEIHDRRSSLQAEKAELNKEITNLEGNK